MAKIKIQRGDIFNINLNPTKGSETGKIRPCIVVTNDIYNKNVPVIQVVPITDWSEKKSKIITNVTLKVDKNNKLTKKSIADCLQTRPIDYEKRFTSYCGKIDCLTLNRIDEALSKVFFM